MAGIALTALYAPNGWIGQLLSPLGIRVAYTPLGIVVALAFVSLPFVVRTLQPVLGDLDREVERAAETLGSLEIADLHLGGAALDLADAADRRGARLLARASANTAR